MDEKILQILRPKTESQIKESLENTADVNRRLYLSVKHNRLEDVKNALASGADPSFDRNFSFIISANPKIDLEIFKLLLIDPRVNLSDRDNVTLFISTGAGDLDRINLILQDFRFTPDKHAGIKRAILWGIAHRQIAAVKLLLSNEKIKKVIAEKELKLFSKKIKKLIDAENYINKQANEKYI